ncbi:MAG TPA: lamin tail domain-containing protein, partial [Anaerolineales bacterium]|nr:lamin tail domain-containing protein [Anaerolineales bacterium]
MRQSVHHQRIRRLALLCIIALGVFAMLFPGAGSLPVRAISSNIVISEFRTRGPNGSNDEFVELYNLSGSAVNIGGWKINGSNSAGSTSTRLTVSAGTILNPGCYYLATNSSTPSYSGSVPGNQTYTTGIADDGGIALLDSLDVVIDQAGMSAGSAYKEGTVLARLTTNVNRSYERKPGGGSGNGQDTDNNSIDFQWLAPSDPQSLSSGCLPYTPTSTPTPSNTSTDTDTPTSTNTPTETGAPAETQTPTQTETPSATPTPTETAANTPTPTPTFTPTVITPGAVVINEVMWMGTTADANDEWIELYNTRSFPIDLTGWTLTFGSTTINLGSAPDAVTATIPAGGYFLLERTDDITVSDIPYDQRYTGALVNAGTIITLRDSSSIVIDTANGDGGPWPAGGATLRASMERIDPAAPDSDGNWATNDGINRNGLDVGGNPIRGTPKQPNSTTYPTATPTSTATLTATATPTASPTAFPARAIAINEVMWMGTTADANDEWIELYNTTGSDIPLTNWTLSIDDGILPEDTVINLSGVIPAGGYFLLERTSIDTVIDEPAPPCVGQTYAGSLANDGRILNLRDPSFISIDTANGNGGPWPAGLESPRASMERINTGPDTDGNWSANYGHVMNGHDADGNPIRGTPCQPNSNLVPTPTPTAFARVSAVRLNEVLPNPGPSEWWLEYGLTHTPEEYVELYNVGGEPVDISYWMIDDKIGGSDPFIIWPGAIINPGDHWLLYVGGLNISFNDDGDSARLLYPDGSVVDEVSWNAQMKDDYSISRDVAGVGTWRFDWRPTPGMGNAPHAVGSRLGLKPTPVVAGIRVARTWDDGAW